MSIQLQKAQVMKARFLVKTILFSLPRFSGYLDRFGPRKLSYFRPTERSSFKWPTAG